MQENIYFYEGVPLTSYCKSHDINPNSIRTRIWKKKNNPKYSHLSDQEIINMVMASVGRGTIYMVGEISLRQYCIENDINFTTISSRINNIKKKNPNLTPDQLVKKALDEFENNNFTLYYENIPLKEYCRLHPEIKYNTIRGHILEVRKKSPNASVKDIIDEYRKKEHFGIYTYYYCGIPLVEYCKEKNISYRAIIARINRYKKNHKVESDDELVNLIMDKYEPFTPKYIYNGVSLNEYCKNNDISYYSVVSYVKRKREKNPALLVDNLIDEAIKMIKKQGVIYYYQGIPLRDYCIINKLNASSIRVAILRHKEKSNLPLQEIVNYCVETWEEAKIKYYYGEEPLFTYCKNNNINYNTVISRYLDLNLTESDAERKKTIAQIVDDIKAHPRTRIKYYFQEQSLRQYCLKKGYSYSAIHRRIKNYQEEFTYTLESEVVEEAVLTYEEKNIIKKNYHYFQTISEKDNIQMYLAEICQSLNLDYESLIDMINMGFDTYQAILLIWYLNPNTPKQMTDNILKDIYNYIAIFKSEKQLDIYILYILYKTCIADTSQSILNYFKIFITEIITKYQPYYRSLTIEEQNNLSEKLESYILMLIDYIYLDDRTKFLKHIMYLIGEYVRNYYTKLINNISDRSLKKEFP